MNFFSANTQLQSNVFLLISFDHLLGNTASNEEIIWINGKYIFIKLLKPIRMGMSP